jgi:hypothetical protein
VMYVCETVARLYHYLSNSSELVYASVKVGIQLIITAH